VIVAAVDVTTGHNWVLVYRPPSCTAEESSSLLACLEGLLLNYKRVTVLGDFNLPSVYWYLDSDHHFGSDERELLLFAESWALKQLVNQSTQRWQCT
jgi:hypothetical protein